MSKSSHERVKRGAVRPTNMLWPDGIIYYKFSADLGKDLNVVKISFGNGFDYY